MTSLRGLEHASRLTSLQILDLDGLVELPNLAGAACLRDLSLKRCELLCEIVGLESAAALSKLCLKGLHAMASMLRLSSFSELRNLAVTGCDMLRFVGSMEGLPVLAELQLQWLPSLSEMPSLSGLSQLSSVVVTNCALLTSIGSFEGLSGLAQLQLRRLESLARVPSLSGLSKLSQLEVLDCVAVTAIDRLEGLDGLAELRIEVLPRLASLDFGPLPGLKSCAMVGLGSLEVAHGLEGLTGLASLALEGAPKLPRKPLEALAELTALHLDGGVPGPAAELPWSLAPLTNLVDLSLKQQSSWPIDPRELSTLIASAGAGLASLRVQAVMGPATIRDQGGYKLRSPQETNAAAVTEALVSALNEACRERAATEQWGASASSNVGWLWTL